MKTKEVFVSRGRTLNMGDYNSERIELGMTVTLDEGEDDLKAIEDLEDTLTEYLINWEARTKE